MVITKKTRSLLIMIAVLAVALLLVRVCAVDILIVSGRSMEPTLEPGRLLLINRLYYGLYSPAGDHYLIGWHKPARGDIVLFLNAYDDTLTVKRCLAVSGDLVKIEAGQLLINDKILPLKYYQEIKWRNHGEVPPGYIFVVGDNLDYSVDSREYGFISARQVLGCAMFTP
jgi:signal peptidase I